MITVAYVDPDNLQSNLTSGAEFKFKLLFMILFSNVVAVFLQVSCVGQAASGARRLRTIANGLIELVDEVGMCDGYGFGADE